MQAGYVKICDFQQVTGYILIMVQDRCIISIKCALTNGDIASGRLVYKATTHVLRARHNVQ